MPNEGYSVYRHISPSGKSYVGISCDPEKRWNNGEGYAKNLFFYRAIKKYGWESFQHIIIASGLTHSEAEEMEKSIIEEEKLTDRTYGYNIREGGDGAHSEESKKKMGMARIRNKNSLGCKHSDESKKKVSEGLKKYYSTNQSKTLGLHFPEMSGPNNVNARTVAMLDWNEDVIKIFDTAKDAAEFASCSVSSIVDCCVGRAYAVKGIIFRYYDKNIDAVLPQNRIPGYECVWKAVRQYDLNNNHIATYRNATEAAHALGIKACNIIKCCSGLYRKMNGYIWKYSEEV